MTAGGQGGESDAVGAEFTRLVESLTEWLRGTLGEPRAAAQECRHCPVCRALAALRGDRAGGTDPVDLTRRLGTVADTVTGLVRTWLDNLNHPDHGPHPRAEPGDPAAAGATPGADSADSADGVHGGAGASGERTGRPHSAAAAVPHAQAGPATVEQIDIS